MTGIVFGEQPRWHENRLWFSDWGTREVIAVDLDGNSEVILQAPSFPCCVDWLPDGPLLVVSGSEGLLLRRETDGSLVTHADLNKFSKPAPWNELIVDGRGNAYINGGGFNLMAGEPFAPGVIMDADDAIWYADVPNKQCVRVCEGGEVLDTIGLDRGCFACALGGLDRKTLLMMAQEWRGPAKMFSEPRTGQVLTTEAPSPGVPWP
jgi:sugar lactone lactonase YvrE